MPKRYIDVLPKKNAVVGQQKSTDAIQPTIDNSEAEHEHLDDVGEHEHQLDLPVLPNGDEPIAETPTVAADASAVLDQQPTEEPINIISQTFRTLANAFGLLREYAKKPLRIPDESSSPVCESPPVEDIISPYPNLSSFRFAHLFSTISRLSQPVEDAIQRLIVNIDFRASDIDNLNFQGLKEKVLSSSGPWGDSDEGWRKGEAKIRIPTLDKTKKKTDNESEGIEYEEDEFWYRPIIPLLKSILTSSQSHNFHFEPFTQKWARPGTNDEPMRVYDELYTADMWLEEHEKVQNIELPFGEPDDYPRAIAALMFWSDSTHLAEFGQAKAWPIYLALGNQSKYERTKPGARALHLIGFLPSVSMNIHRKSVMLAYQVHVFVSTVEKESRGIYRSDDWC